MQTALRLSGLQKSFGGTHALRRGDLEVRSGEVHLVLGENGAGKSTMMKIAAGMLAPDGGSIAVGGRPLSFANPRQSQDAGIAMVHQESLLAPHLTVADNLFLGREESSRIGTLDPRRSLDAARRLISRYGFPIEASTRVGDLGPAGRQLVEICRALAHDASVLIFDEPTSALSETEAAQVFRIIDDLREQGRAVIYITHRMNELRRLGDHATVLRDGETVFSGPMGNVSNEQLIQWMVGRSVTGSARRAAVPPGRELLRAAAVTRRGVFEDVSFSVHAGEVVGVAGLMGAGRTEICRALFGIDPLDSGEVFLEGRPFRPTSPGHAVRNGLAFIPEDRQLQGLAAQRSIAENATLPALRRFSPYGILHRASELEAVSEVASKVTLRAGAPSQAAGQLSGGNQQKVVLAKWLLARSRVFLLDEPTRGIDIGAKGEVAALIGELARNGAAILLVSSELPELLTLADRILVLRLGRVTAELSGDTTQEEIMRHAALA